MRILASAYQSVAAFLGRAEVAVEKGVEAKLSKALPKLEAAGVAALEAEVAVAAPALAPLINEVIDAEAPEVEAEVAKLLNSAGIIAAGTITAADDSSTLSERTAASGRVPPRAAGGFTDLG